MRKKMKGDVIMADISSAMNRLYSEEEINRCTQVIKTIVSLAHKGQTEGLLSLEQNISELKPFLLRKGIEILSNGCSPGSLRSILDNYINAGNFTGIELMERIIIREGVLLIQAGDKPKMLFEKLVCMLGEDFCNSIEGQELLVFLEDSYKDTTHSRQKDVPMITDKTTEIEEALMKIEDYEDMERLFRMAGEINISFALKGVRESVIDHVKKYIGSNELIRIMKNSYPKSDEILEAQKQVLRALHY
jgi:hypothetical protein